ncbi:MAG TPA: mechanosensitive ion channel protein MscS [Cytophagales bacterium]|nr:mechanosensitive ion channel protein MscS [Cytophagales bacterium]HAA20110.1 mechanosensitive ion channel protein MscS [Cytophagales bacterium]HAP64084.1 mechanosensitive ion channel protein MscS [Cytophagales bacterium]
MDQEDATFWDKALSFLEPLWDALHFPLFHFNEKPFSFLTLIGILAAVIGLFWVANRVRRLLVKRILPHYRTNQGIAESIGTITRYLILIIGVIVIFQSAGIDLSTLSILAGALGIGIGFGLQNIANNFISGIIILLENPIKVGDRIEVGEVQGNVTEIKARSTIINTNDNIDIIVPNSAFIDGQVINWSLNDRKVRIKLPFGVSYSEKPARVQQLLLELVDDIDGVMKEPGAEVWFVGYGDSSIDFELVFWTRKFIERPEVIRSQLYYAIFEKFEEENIEIPFPQRDIHIRSNHTQQQPPMAK